MPYKRGSLTEKRPGLAAPQIFKLAAKMDSVHLISWKFILQIPNTELHKTSSFETPIWQLSCIAIFWQWQDTWDPVLNAAITPDYGKGQFWLTRVWCDAGKVSVIECGLLIVLTQGRWGPKDVRLVLVVPLGANQISITNSVAVPINHSALQYIMV